MNRRCYDHKTTETAPVLCHTCTRIGVEADIVTMTVDALLAAGYLLQTDMNEDPRPEKPTRDRAAILAEMMEVDDEFLGVWFAAVRDQEQPNADDTRPDAWVRFVYGNGGYDVVSDYNTRLEAVLAPVNAYANTLCP